MLTCGPRSSVRDTKVKKDKRKMKTKTRRGGKESPNKGDDAMRCDAWKAGMHCASVRCEMKVSLMVCCFCPPCPLVQLAYRTAQSEQDTLHTSCLTGPLLDQTC